MVGFHCNYEFDIEYLSGDKNQAADAQVKKWNL